MSEPEEITPPAWSKRWWECLRTDPRWHMGAIIALALIPRMIYLAQIMRWPFLYSPVLDSRTQYEWGALLLRTFGIGNGAAMSKGPLYAYYLALNQMMFGGGHPSLFSARFIQLLLSAVTCGLIYLLGRRVFGNAVGLLAGLMAAAYSPTVFEDGEMLDTALATFLATTLLLSVLASLERPTRGRWFGCGVLLGLLALTRPNLLLLGGWGLALVLVWERRQRPLRDRLGWAWPCLVGMLVAIAPITARNYGITHEFVAIANNGGINFYTGNNAEADGYSPIPAGAQWERVQYQPLNAIPGIMTRGTVSVRKADAYWIREGLAFWRKDTGKALALLVKKAYLCWNAYEIPNNVSYDWGRRQASVLRALPLTFALAGGLGLLGIVFGGWRSREGWALSTFVLTQMVTVIAFFVCGRYRMPALPVVFVFAGWALVAVVGMLRRRRWRPAAAGLAGLVLCGLVVNSDWYGVSATQGANRDWLYVGQSYYYTGQYRQAKAAWEQAIKQHPDDADAYSFLGNAEVELGEYRSAVEHMRRAVELAPDFGNAAAQMAQVYLDQGWPLEKPAKPLERAARADYLNPLALGTLVRVHVRMGRLEQAKADLESAARAVTLTTPVGQPILHLHPALATAVREARDAGVPIPEVLLRAGSPLPPGGL